MSSIPSPIIEAAAVAAELHAHKIVIGLGVDGRFFLNATRPPPEELIERWRAMLPAVVGALGWLVPVKVNANGAPIGAGWKRWVLS